MMTSKPMIPVGTQVVSQVEICSKTGDVLFPAGAVGIIIKAPEDVTNAYRVRFLDGSEHSLTYEQLAIRSHHQNPSTPDDYLAGVDLYQQVVYRCVVGSRAYGLAHGGSDTDLRGIYLPPAELHWSLFGVPEQLEGGEEAYWELQNSSHWH